MATLAEKLRSVLLSKSKEQIKQEWEEIKALNLEGPLFSDFFQYYTENKSSQSYIESNVKNEIPLTNFEHNNYSLAS